MKCEQIQKNALLAQSGELSWLGRQALSRHLRACEACRRFQADLNAVTAHVRASGSAPALGAAVLERIQHAARKESNRSELIHIRPSHEPFVSVFRPAIMYSALALLLLAGFWLTVRPALNQSQTALQRTVPATPAGEEWDTAGIDTQIETLDEWLDVATTDDDASSLSNGTENEDVDSIAREHLEMESEQI